MAKKADYSNTHKFDNRKSFDGQPVPAGKVLVPFRKDIYELQEGDYIDENCTTMHLGCFKYDIAFMAIDEAQYASYMREFWDELNKDMEMRRKCLLERCNPKRVEILLLDYEYDVGNFDIADESQPSVENQVLNKLCVDPTEEELQIKNLLMKSALRST